MTAGQATGGPGERKPGERPGERGRGEDEQATGREEPGRGEWSTHSAQPPSPSHENPPSASNCLGRRPLSARLEDQLIAPASCPSSACPPTDSPLDRPSPLSDLSARHRSGRLGHPDHRSAGPALLGPAVSVHSRLPAQTHPVQPIRVPDIHRSRHVPQRRTPRTKRYLSRRIPRSSPRPEIRAQPVQSRPAPEPTASAVRPAPISRRDTVRGSPSRLGPALLLSEESRCPTHPRSRQRQAELDRIRRSAHRTVRQPAHR